MLRGFLTTAVPQIGTTIKNATNVPVNSHGILSGSPSIASASRTGRDTMMLASNEPNVIALHAATTISVLERGTCVHDSADGGRRRAVAWGRSNDHRARSTSRSATAAATS